MMPVLDTLLDSALRGLGCELVEVQAGNRGRMLRVFIDKPGGITVEDCAAVSRHLGRVLEVEGIDYDRLEVSSPGLDRPLRTAEEFRRFVGRKADVRMRWPDETGRRRFVGRVLGVSGEQLELELDGRAVGLTLAGVDRARLVPEF